MRSSRRVHSVRCSRSQRTRAERSRRPSKRALRATTLPSVLIEELRAGWPPSVLLLEDVHWADEATLDVLKLLGRRIASVPALVVVSYRDDELDATHPLRHLLGQLVTRRAIRRVPVDRLSRRKRSRHSPARRASMPRSYPAGRPGTPSSSPKCSPLLVRRFRRRCATQCWHAARGSEPEHARCSRP